MTRAEPILPSTVATKAGAAYRRRLRQWLTDPTAAESDSLVIALNPPTESQVADAPDEVRDWVRTWRAYDGAGDVEWATRRWPSFGTQDVPIRVALRGADTIATAAGHGVEWRRLLGRRARLLALGTHPDDRARRAVAATATTWGELDESEFDYLLAALRWLLDNPRSGLLIRQLPVPGVHTKWVSRRRGLIESLLAGFRDDGDLGVRTLPRLHDIAILDRRLLPGAPRVFAASIDEIAALPIHPTTVLVLENKEGVHALPDLPGAVAVHGGGYSVPELATLPWLVGADACWYWGDLDSHGFAILNRLRHHLPGVRSLLMDHDTLDEWLALAVVEPTLATGDFTLLTDPETAVLDTLRGARTRLEQERIPWPYVLDKITRATAPSCEANPRRGC